MVAKKNIFDLVEAVKEARQDYPVEKMESIWRLLYASFKGILSADGDNSYSHHTGSCAAHSKSAQEGDRHDHTLATEKIKAAELKRNELEKALSSVTNEIVSTSDMESSNEEQ